MKTIRILSIITLLRLILIAGVFSQEFPNVILILTDDQGYGDYAIHGNPILKTPALDKLYNESVRLTDFHVAPMCSPTRGQLMTGMDALRNGATAVCQGRSMIRNDIKIMPEYFAESGYSTGHFGKWHLGDSYPHRPQDRGFQETLHHPAWGITSLADHFGNTYWDPYLNHNGIEQRYTGYITDILFREAMQWMKDQKEKGKPFFLYLPINTPHVPNWVDTKYSKPYSDIGTYKGVKVPANFYGMIANIDENMSELDAFLKKENLVDNTIMIYLNDNGTQSREASEIFNAGMREHKTSMYDGGHRVACFWRWPKGGLQPGRDIDILTQVQDILPTLVELCNLNKSPSNIDGIDLSTLLKGEKSKLEDRKLVIQYSFGETSGTRWNHAVVLWDKWRLVGPEELYNIEKDPDQDFNVIHQFPDIAQTMHDYYEIWYEEAKIRYDKPRYITIGSSVVPEQTLYANDWQGGYCDNPPNLLAANTFGYWDLEVAESGEYTFELRRWPEESKLTLTQGVKGETIKAHESFSGENLGARPIYYASLELGGFQETKIIQTGDTFVRFETELPKGKTKLSTLFSDENGEPLCSAIYVKVIKN